MLHLKHPQDVLFILVSYMPVPEKIGEMKTKPTQSAVRTLNSAGIQPDFIIARSECPLDELRKRKISIFCNLGQSHIISAPDIQNVYEVDEDGEKTGKAFNRAVISIPRKTMLILTALNRAMKGDIRALELIWNRAEGKVEQPLNHKGEVAGDFIQRPT